jgi:flagellar motor protein MotB
VPRGYEGATFESNWSLLLARAVSVSKALAASGYDGAFYVLSVGDSRYRHLSAQLSEFRRNALSCRVDIIIYSTAGVL